jgi:hypothetical protein
VPTTREKARENGRGRFEATPNERPGTDQQRVTPPLPRNGSREKNGEGQTNKRQPEMGTGPGPSQQQPVGRPNGQQPKVKEHKKQAPPEQEQAPPDEGQPKNGKNNHFNGR